MSKIVVLENEPTTRIAKVCYAAFMAFSSPDESILYWHETDESFKEKFIFMVDYRLKNPYELYGDFYNKHLKESNQDVFEKSSEFDRKSLALIFSIVDAIK